MVLSELTDSAAVESALREFDRLGREAFLAKYKFGRSREYFLMRDGTAYDSKPIVAAAYGYQFPERGALRNEDFSGGDSTVRPTLERLGFSVRRSGADDPGLSQILSEVLELQPLWSHENTEEMHRRGHLIRSEGPARLREWVTGDPTLNSQLKVEGSNGRGSIARVPWIRIFDPRVSPVASRGWYIVYLFAHDGSAVFLSLNQATAQEGSVGNRPRPVSELHAQVTWARGRLGKYIDERLEEQISLRDQPGGKGGGYELGNVYAFRYPHGAVLDDEQLRKDFATLIRMLNDLSDSSEVLDGGDDRSPTPEDLHVTRSSWQALMRTTLWAEEDLQAITNAIHDGARQIVLAGPPGTGKSHVSRALADYLTQRNRKAWRFVQFHPTYGYEEFVEGLRPVQRDGQVVFQVQNGIVKQMVASMAGDTSPHVLVIDEMNRANLPRVFGELMYLFEYRDDPIDLQYSHQFALPSNLIFIGTMNTADRSIRSLDVALRRRFEVFECPPDRHILERFYSEDSRNEVTGLFDGFDQLNEALTGYLDRHHAIGHTFFMAPRMTPLRLRNVWTRQVGSLIEEYFFDQPDVAAEFTLERFWPDL